MSEGRSLDIVPKRTREKFIADAKKLFSLEDGQINIILNELQTKGHSFSHSHTSQLLHRNVALVNKLVAIVLYSVHLKISHGFTLDDIEKGFKSLGCDSTKVSSFVSRLKTFTDETNEQVDALYWITLDRIEDTRITKIDGSLSYTNLQSEELKMYGLTPIINLKIELQNTDQGKKVFSLHHPLEGLEQIIENLNEIYHNSLEDIKTLKQQSGVKLVGVPKESE